MIQKLGGCGRAGVVRVERAWERSDGFGGFFMREHR